MGFGDFISSKLESNYLKNELKKEHLNLKIVLKMKKRTIYTNHPYDLDTNDAYQLLI